MLRSCIVALATLSLALPACVTTSEDTADDARTGESQAALSGSDTFLVPSTNGIVRISGPSANVPSLQGVLVRPNMVVTSLYALPSLRNINLTVETRPNSQGQRETQQVIDAIPIESRQMALLLLRAPLSERPVVFDTRPFTAPTRVRCTQLRADGTHRAAFFTAKPIPGSTLFLLDREVPNVWLDTVNDGDYGLACGDGSNVKGTLIYANAPSPTVSNTGLMANVADLAPFFAAQDEVFNVRLNQRQRPFSLSTTINGVRKCLHVDTVARMMDCDDYRKEQEFYFDDRGSAAGGGSAIMSAWRGQCLTGIVSPVPFVQLLTARCDQTRIQNFGLTFTPSGDAQYVQAQTRRCLTNSNTSPWLTTDCSASEARDWSLKWQ